MKHMPSFSLSHPAGRGFARWVWGLALPLLLLGACGSTHPGANVPQPPVLEGVLMPSAEPEAPPAGGMPAVQVGPGAAVAPSRPAQNIGMQELLARSDVSVRLIDAGRTPDLRAWLAPFLQASGQGDRILADIAQARVALGPIQGRSRAGVSGIQTVRLGPESQLPPPGLYANVEYTAQRVQGGAVVERLSFRQESDGWRLTGYTAQLPPASP